MKKEDTSLKGDWHPSEYVGFDILKIIFGILFLGLFTYIIYTYVVFPFGLIYKINKTIQITFISILFSIGLVLIVVKSRKRSDEEDVKMDYGIN